MDKIAIFGGTFNPIHQGHLHVAKQYQQLLGIQKLLLIPTYVPPHKHAAELASARERLQMCRLACEGTGFEVSDIEVRRGGASYTSDTLVELKQIYPGSELFLLMGEDMFLTLEKWHEPELLFSLCTLCAAPRSNHGLASLKKYAEKIEPLGAKTILENIEYLPISSTMVRQAVKIGKSTEGLVPDGVAEYISQKWLYRTEKAGGIPMNQRNYKEIIKPFLSQKRYKHSLAVADAAVRLAKENSVNEEKAYIAGILHDIMKDTVPDEQLKMIMSYDIVLSDVERGARKLWHAILGEAYVENELQIMDKEILDAIRYHTTGRANMTLLDKVLFIADFISDDRDYDGVDMMRQAASQGLSEAMLRGTAFTINDLATRKMPIHPDTVAAYNQAVLEYGKTD